MFALLRFTVLYCALCRSPFLWQGKVLFIQRINPLHVVEAEITAEAKVEGKVSRLVGWSVGRLVGWSVGRLARPVG